MQFELALSAKVLTFVQDTVRGRLDPNKISGYHDFKRKDVNLTPVLEACRMKPRCCRLSQQPHARRARSSWR